MYRKLSVAVIVLSVIGTLAILLYLCWPWGDESVAPRLSEYGGLLSLVLWAIAPYLPLLVKTLKSPSGQAGNLLMLIGCAAIGAAGCGIYLDAVLKHPAPLSALLFLVLPLYQWGAVLLLLLINYTWVHFCKSFRSSGKLKLL